MFRRIDALVCNTIILEYKQNLGRDNFSASSLILLPASLAGHVLCNHCHSHPVILQQHLPLMLYSQSAVTWLVYSQSAVTCLVYSKFAATCLTGTHGTVQKTCNWTDTV